MAGPVRALLPQHSALIDGSAISAEVAATRGYFSVSEPRELAGMFGPSQRLAPALVIPVYDPWGERAFYVLRPDRPRVKGGRTLKYEMPAGAGMTLDVPPFSRPALADASVRLWVTEGVRKADALVSVGVAAVALLGVWNWRGKNERGGKVALADWEAVALNDAREVIVCFDSDAFENAGVHGAMERLAAFLTRRGASVAFAYLPPGKDGRKVGVDDYLASGATLEDLLRRVARDLRPLPSAAARPRATAPGGPLRGTGELIGEVAALLDRFVVLPSRGAALAVALYVLHTHAFAAAHATPYLVLQSPVKRAGKTRMEEVLELLVRAPWRVAAASESAMFRKIDGDRPTLLLDEVDALFGAASESTEPVRAVLNAGNRPGAAVARVVGDGAGMTVVDFSVFCPKVLAGISTARWPDTIVDRSIVIQLRRKRPDETVERLRYRALRAETEPLRSALSRWAHEHEGALRDAEPVLPDGLDDRSAEGWEPLLAIADFADSERSREWGERARRAAVNLARERVAEDDAPAVLALTAMRGVFGDEERVTTERATTALNGDDQLPFGAFRKGLGIDGRGLARLLRAFGIRPTTVRTSSTVLKGYRREDFLDSWERYSVVDDDRTRFPPDLAVTPLQPSDGGLLDLDVDGAAHSEGPGAAAISGECNGVTDNDRYTAANVGNNQARLDDGGSALAERACQPDSPLLAEALRRFAP
jgi:hypothetical protein